MFICQLPRFPTGNSQDLDTESDAGSDFEPRPEVYTEPSTLSLEDQVTAVYPKAVGSRLVFCLFVLVSGFQLST